MRPVVRFSARGVNINKLHIEIRQSGVFPAGGSEQKRQTVLLSAPEAQTFTSPSSHKVFIRVAGPSLSVLGVYFTGGRWGGKHFGELRIGLVIIHG